jgi:hypothetical protein
MFLAMGLNPKNLSDSLHGGLGQVRLSRDRTTCPVGAVRGFGCEGLANQGRHLFVTNRGGTSRPGFIVQSGDALLKEPSAPQANHSSQETNLVGNSFVIETVSGQQNNSGAP